MTRRPVIRVMIVDDHEVVRAGVASMLQTAGDMDVVGQAANAPEAITVARQFQPHVILLDIRLPGISGWEVCRMLTSEVPGARVLMLTSFGEEDYLLKALRAGARGYLLKTATYEEIVQAVRAVARGERLLSPEMVDKLVAGYAALARDMERLHAGLDEDEIEILQLVARGATNADVAAETHWSEVSVKRKLQAIFDKLGVADRTSAAVEAVRRGLV